MYSLGNIFFFTQIILLCIVSVMAAVAGNDFFNSIFDKELMVRTDMRTFPRGISHVEIFDLKRAGALLNNREALMKSLPSSGDEVYETLEKYVAASSHVDGGQQGPYIGKTVTHFIPSKRDPTGFGRLYPEHGVSLSAYKKVIRAELANDLYYDIDMVNAHPAIIRWLCSCVGIACPLLEKYIAERKECLNDVIAGAKATHPELTLDNAKSMVLSVIYKDNGVSSRYKDVQRSAWLKSFIAEMSDIKALISVRFAKIHEMRDKYLVSTKQEQSPNPKGSLLSYIVNVIENRLLFEAVDALAIVTPMSDIILSFDGMLLQRSHVDKVGIAKCIKRVNERYKGFGTGVTVMSKKFTRSAELEALGDVKMNWAVFSATLKSHTFTAQKLHAWFAVNAYRALFISGDAPGRIIVESSGEYHELSPTHGGISTRVTGLAKKPTTVKSCTLGDLMNNHGFVRHIPTYIRRGFLIGKDAEADPSVFSTFPGFSARADLCSFDFGNSDVGEPVWHKTGHEDLDLFLSHIVEVLACDDIYSAQYMFSWIAHIVLKPHIKTSRAVFLYSEKQGLGKSLVAQFLRDKVFGNPISTSEQNLRTFCKGFNSQLADKIFIMVEELSTERGASMQGADSLKDMITNSHPMIETKGVKVGILRKGYQNFMLMSNHRDALEVEESDRRFLMLELSDKYYRNADHYKRLANALTSETADALVKYIGWIDREHPDWLIDVITTEPPQTKLKQEHRLANAPTHILFMLKLKELFCSEDELDEVVRKLYGNLVNDRPNWVNIVKNGVKYIRGIYHVPGAVLYRAYMDFHDSVIRGLAFRFECNEITLGTEMKKHMQCVKTSGVMMYRPSTLRMDEYEELPNAQT